MRFRGRGRAGDEDKGSKAGSRVEVVFFSEGVGSAEASRFGEGSAILQVVAVLETMALQGRASRVGPAGTVEGRAAAAE